MNRKIYLLIMEDYQEREPKIITENDYLESEIKKLFPTLYRNVYALISQLTNKGDKAMIESPFNNRKIVVELINY